MANCVRHKDRASEYVCVTCAKYYCGDCVSERFYPTHGWICHNCSGQEIWETSTESEEETPDKKTERKAARSASSQDESWMAPGIEWAIVAACVVFIGVRLALLSSPADEVIELKSSLPEDVASYCLDMLDDMESKGAAPGLMELETACPYPIEVAEVDGMYLVTTPDADRFGFTEIEVELNPMLITVME